VGHLEAAPVARDQQRPVALAGAVVGSHGVYDPAGIEAAGGRPAGVADVEPVGEPGDAVRQDLGSAGGVDGAIDAPAAPHPAVGGVDDGVDGLGGDVALDDGDLGHQAGSSTGRVWRVR